MSKLSEDSNKAASARGRSSKAEPKAEASEVKRLRPIIEGMFYDETATRNALVSDVKRLGAEHQAKGSVGFDATAFYRAHEHAIWGLLYDTAISEHDVNILKYMGGFKGAGHVTSMEDFQAFLAHWARDRIAKDVSADPDLV